MAIDGIGRKGPVAPPPTAGVGGAPGVSPTPAFDLGATETAPGASSPVQAAAPTPLDQVRAGTITPSEYVDLKVQEATAHLTMLSPAELESVQSALRDRIATDPSLAELTQAATSPEGSGGARP